MNRRAFLAATAAVAAGCKKKTSTSPPVPAAEPGPVCDEHHIPYVAVLQLRAEDAPPNWPFRDDADLFQLLWCPRVHGPGWVKPSVMWRKRASVSEPLAEPPATDAAFLD